MSARRHTKTESVLCILLFLLARKLKTMENTVFLQSFMKKEQKVVHGGGPDHIYIYMRMYVDM